MGETREGLIYGLSCACHPEDGVRYIGQTIVGIRRRVSQHKAESRRDVRRPVCRWIQKHGEDNICVIEVESIAGGDINEREMYWIASFRQRGYGLLNATDGGQGPTGMVTPAETKAAIGHAQLGHLVSIETREKISLAHKGRVFTSEARRNMSKAALLRAPATPEARARQSARMLNHPVSQETRDKISASNAGRTRQPDDIARQVATRARNGSGCGTAHWNARLDWEKVRDIRSRPTESTASLGLEFGVKADTIRKIRTGRLWPEVGPGLRAAA